MMAERIAKNRINAALKQPSRVVVMVAFIASISGMILDLVNYISRHLNVLVLINSIALVIFIILFPAFLLKKLNLKISFQILTYIMVINILITHVFSANYNLPDWQLDFLRGTLIIAVFLSATALILSKTDIIIINLLYLISFIIVQQFSPPNFITENLFFFVIILVSFSLSIMVFMERLRKSLLENQTLQQMVFFKNKEILQRENELMHERSVRLQENLDLKNRELLTNALVLTKQIEDKKKLLDKLQMLIGKLAPEEKKELQDILSELSATDSSLNWDEFQKRFENVHQDFYENLTHAYPGLSPAELKLAAFIKLGLSSKEISALTNNTVSSTEVARSRLRKKIKLQASENLSSYLSKF